MAEPLKLEYFSDVLCVWAYVAQIRLEELQRQFGDQLAVSYHFFPLFGCTEGRIGHGWADRGGFAAFGEHVKGVCGQFDHVTVHSDVWRAARPKSSAMAHYVLKAAQLLEDDGVVPSDAVAAFNGRSAFEELAWRMRRAFFCDVRNIASLDVLLEVAQGVGLPGDALRERLENGAAMAAMCRDVELANQYKVEGSPTYVLNAGRQKLYGNLGYKILAANVYEVLNRPQAQASWC